LNKKLSISLMLCLLILLSSVFANAMHIMEGFLPPVWSIAWIVACIPFVIWGVFSIRRKVERNPRTKMLLGLAGAFAFVLSALKLPSVTGSCSHPTGVGLGAILFGPSAMSVIGIIVLLFQALLLAHGGLTTLGANAFSMAVVGPLTAYGVYKLTKKLNAPSWFAVFLAAALGNLLTYAAASFQLALAFPASHGGFAYSLLKFMSIFAVTQIPLAISEGVLTVLIFNIISQYNKQELLDLSVM